ncbi:MAG TPA: dTMP kinase [Solirubrobacteraceae bacterium]|nr:dTMP kinase [Solirubrobacteraceae bacterium]
MAGALITIEGLDGAGKSTLAESLARELAAGGTEVELLREPGGVEASERIRELVQDPRLEILPRAEALLYAAARAQLVEELLRPLLERGAVVVLDRFVDSSLAYQGGARRLGIERVAEINAFATGGLQPDLTLLLSVEPRVGRSRQLGRSDSPDRLEREDESFFERVAAAYAQIAAAATGRVRVIDASRPPEEVLAQALDAVAVLLGDRRGSA